ncbi:putative amino-acid permease C15C4.04c [Pseudocercospora fuligena]|uniref:Putative amino-acid permease C15C4.04c n=1 Tax=Pseudocercospora fuligena TaxID=685502 RepID=A0A8H6RSD8_9PEZI|nr:putative amino-acid permease C15C4.04c [Pseudocercospora fuligena]
MEPQSFHRGQLDIKGFQQRQDSITSPEPVMHIKVGTAQDERDMHRLGKVQRLNRSFHYVSILAFTIIVMSVWMTTLTVNVFPLINGGRAGTIWTYLGSWVCMTAVSASIAEMASMAPTCGGQYHWVSEFAPLGAQKALSYWIGWLSALSWQGFIASSCFQAGNLVLILASLTHPMFAPMPWHGTLMTMAIAFVVTSSNVFAAKYLPQVEKFMLVFHVLTFVVFLAVLWATAPLAPARDVFGTFSNYGVWSSVGAARWVGQVAGGGALLGMDSAAHMSEEVEDASMAVPRMIMASVTISGALGFIFTITFVFIIQDVESQIADSTAYYPFIAVFATAIGSTGAAIGLTVMIIFLGICAAISAMAAATRQAWSFARDSGLPFSTWFMTLTNINGVPTPLHAMIASLLICMVIALLNLGRAETWNSIVGLVAGAMCFSYLISISCVLWRRLFGAPLPPARWSLGKTGGPAINSFSCLYLINLITASFFPLYSNVTAKTMNWGIAMFAGVALLSIVYYLAHGRKVYKGPVVHLRSH